MLQDEERCPASLPGDLTGTTESAGRLEDALWLLAEEQRAVARVRAGLDIERVYDFAGPRDVFYCHWWRYAFAAAFVAEKSVLDIACGSGYGSELLLTRGGAKRVMGADLDPDAVRYARLRYGSRHEPSRLRYAAADACEPCMEERFDAVVSFETIEHVPRPDRMLAGITKMLTGDGLLVISTPVRRMGTLTAAPGNPFHLREWTVDEFGALMKEHFGEVELFGQQWPILRWTRRLPVSETVRIKLKEKMARRAGYDPGDWPRVRPLHSVSRSLTVEPPNYLIAVCRKPRPSPDPSAVLRLCYGD